MPDTQKKRGRPKGTSSKPNTLKSGIAYVYDDFVEWSDPEHTINTIRQSMRNPIFARAFRVVTNLVFPEGEYVLTVEDQDEHYDEEAAKKLRWMFETPECNLEDHAKLCWGDWFFFGPYPLNIVYSKFLDADGWKLISELRHLPPQNFSCYPMGSKSADGTGVKVVSQSELLPGISMFSDGKIHYWQNNENGTPTELYGVTHFKPPYDMTGDPAGMPLCYPGLSILEKWNFCWRCQMSRTSRVGAPSIFIKVTDPQERTDPNTGVKTSDLELAQTILKNWNNNNQFSLLGNMEPIPIPTNESDSAMETIRELSKMWNDMWSPTAQISTEGGSKLGGSDEAAVVLLLTFLSGILNPVSKVFEQIGNEVLAANGYVGYSVKIKFPLPHFDNGELDLKRAIFGVQNRLIFKNEARELIGQEPLTEKDWKKLQEEYAQDPSLFTENMNDPAQVSEPIVVANELNKKENSGSGEIVSA